MKIYEFACGDELHFFKKSLLLWFQGKRNVLSTGLNQGGCHSDLEAVFNNDGNPGPGIEFLLRADTYEEHMDVIAVEDLGLNPRKCSGMCTAASMDNVSIQSMEGNAFTVTAIVTGGIETNGARSGDPSCYQENAAQNPLGTINIMLHIDADLPDGTLVKALASCVEAKVTAIQELMPSSRYSNGLATGSGTDGVIVVCNPISSTRLTDAGHHSQLGEFIAKTVKKAVKEALYRQTNLGPESQHDIIRRMDRFGITQDILWNAYSQMDTEKIPRFRFESCLEAMKREDALVTYTSLLAHLLDQLEWGLLKPQEVWEAGQQILHLAELGDLAALSEEKTVVTSKEDTLLRLVEAYKTGLLRRIQEICSIQ